MQLVRSSVALPVVCVVNLLVPFSLTFSCLLVKLVLVSQVALRQAIHAVRHSLSQFGTNDESLALLKIDMKNALLMNVTAPLSLMVYVKSFQRSLFGCTGAYTANLLNCGLATNVFLLPQVSNREILLVPYFFPWCWCNLFIPSLTNQCLLSVWYLDDGTFIGTRS